MRSAPPLLSFLLMIVSGWVHRHPLIVIECLQTENRLLQLSGSSVTVARIFGPYASPRGIVMR